MCRDAGHAYKGIGEDLGENVVQLNIVAHFLVPISQVFERSAMVVLNLVCDPVTVTPLGHLRHCLLLTNQAVSKRSLDGSGHCLMGS